MRIISLGLIQIGAIYLMIFNRGYRAFGGEFLIIPLFYLIRFVFKYMMKDIKEMFVE